MKNQIGIALLSLLLLPGCTQKSKTFQGETEATQIDVSVKIPGRIRSLAVFEGQAVSKDTVLGQLESREVSAKMKSAKAGSTEASEQLLLAKNTYARLQELFKEGAITKQQLDEARYKYEASRQKVSATEGTVDEVGAALDETAIKSPIAGEVTKIIANPGELVSPGYPIINLVDLSDQWVTFNVREDLLSEIKKDKVLNVEIPALKNKVPMKVTYISALGAFARWRSTAETGRFDLKTFEIRARPEKPVEGLRPGMTAIITLEN